MRTLHHQGRQLIIVEEIAYLATATPSKDIRTLTRPSLVTRRRWSSGSDAAFELGLGEFEDEEEGEVDGGWEEEGGRGELGRRTLRGEVKLS